jgi:hypothetical protein
MSLYKITRLTSEKENQRLSQIAKSPLDKAPLYNQFVNQKSDDDKDIGGVNSAALSANKPGGWSGEGNKGGDFQGPEGGGKPAEMTISPEILLQIQSMNIPAEEKKRLLNRYMEGELTDFAGQVRDNSYIELIPKLQILHRQFMTSAPNARENFMTEAKAILYQFKNSMSASDLNYIRTNLPGFARLI